MAKNCSYCGQEIEISYNCAQCNSSYCFAHNEAHSHDCESLNSPMKPDEMANDWVSDSSEDAWSLSSSTRKALSRNEDQSIGVPILGNVTTTIIALCVLVFSFQWVIYPLLGYPIGDNVWMSTFVFQTSEPLYVWTWFISIFSHGSLVHLIVNSIVILSFGVTAEKILGQKKYLVFYLISGLAAGILYITLGLVIGQSVSIVGASGAASAIVGYLAVVRPDIKVLLFFIIPMSIRTMATLLLVGSTAIVAMFGIGAFGVGHIAHIVGLLFGIGYGKKLV